MTASGAATVAGAACGPVQTKPVAECGMRIGSREEREERKGQNMSLLTELGIKLGDIFYKYASPTGFMGRFKLVYWFDFHNFFFASFASFA